MWFKNLRVYKLTQPIGKGIDLPDALAKKHFTPCGSLDLVQYGFVPPVPNGIAFTHEVLGCTVFCLKREEKILPSSAVKKAVAEKAKAISEAENRSVGRKEMAELNDEIIFSMLPKAFTKESLDYAYIDHKEKLIVVNASTAKRAEDVCSKLREALGSLRCIPLACKIMPSQLMTLWLKKGLYGAANLEFGSSIEMHSGKDGRVIRCRHQDLTANEVLAHIESGMYVSKLALVWNGGISFTLDEDLGIKGLKFDDSISEKANEQNPETKADQFDADFAVMSIELRALIDDLVYELGGTESYV